MKIGILGGIGPEATSYFYSRLIEKLKKSGKIKRNKDFPQIIINSVNAQELTSKHTQESDLDGYVKGIIELSTHKPDFIVMACNTIHIYIDLLKSKSGYESILSLKEIVELEISNTKSTICILGTPSTVSSGLYKYKGRQYQNPTIDQSISVGKIVESYNSNGEQNVHKEELLDIMEFQKKNGAEVFLTACTEVSEILQHEKKFKILSTLDILIESVFQKIINH